MLKPDMTFDEAQQRAIDSGLLSPEEVEKIKTSLIRMREIAERKKISYADQKELDKLRYIFDDLAVKGMPEYEHLRPKSQSLAVKMAPYIIGVFIVIAYLFFQQRYA